MQTKLSRRAVGAGALATLGMTATRSLGQGWPSRPIRIVVPFPPGNAGDVSARLISDRLAERLSTPVFVENKPGASGILGTRAVKTAEPDGYTLLVTSLSPLVVLQATRDDLAYDTLKDFAPVSLIGRLAMALVAANSYPATTLGEVVKEAKASPGKYFYSHVGPGSLSHLSMLLLTRAAELDITGVAFKGSGEAMTEMIAGRVQLMIDGITSSFAHVRAGTVRGIAINSAKRSSIAPELPTFRESGVPVDYDIEAWTGLLAPSGTPKEIVDRLNAEMGTLLREEALKARARSLFLDPYEPHLPTEFHDFLRAELDKWVAVHKVAGIATVR